MSTGCSYRAEQCFAGFSQRRGVRDTRRGADALARAFSNWFGKKRVGKINRGHVLQRLDDRKPWRGHSCSSDDGLGQTFVQRQRQDERVRERVRDSVHVQNGRHLRFAGDAAQSLGDVEHQVPRIALRDLRHELPSVPNSVRRMAKLCERRFDAFNGARPVKFGRFIWRKPRIEIILPQVVSQADPHGPKLARSREMSK